MSENLKPFGKVRSVDEAREAGRKGGLASGRSRNLKKIALERLGAGAGDEIIDAMIAKAKSGDVKAAEFIRDTSGQKPKDEVEVKDVSDRAKYIERLLNAKD